MRNKTILLLLAATLLLVVACHKPLPPAGDKVEAVPEVDDPLRQYVESDTLESFDYLAATFTATVAGQSVNGTLRIARDSVIWVSAAKIIELGRAKITPDSLFAVVRIGNRYIACSLDEVRSGLGIDIDFATVQDVLLGNGSHKSVLLVEYDNFDTIGGEELPRKLDLTLNDRRFYTTATLHYHSITLNQPASYPWTLPKNGVRLWPKETTGEGDSTATSAPF